jgi:hypothetical protein
VRSQQYRLDNKGALFDMLSDAGQQTDIAKDQPEIASKLVAAIARWRSEVLMNPKPNRPFTVGYPEFPRTPLPARDGIAHGGIQRSSKAPNCSYFVNWKDREDRITWDIAVNTTGEYEVELLYTCPAADVGSVIELEFQGSKLTGKVAPGWDPPLYTNQDTLPRPPAESRMKAFRSLQLGVVKLEKGTGVLSLRAVEIPGNAVMDLRQLNLTLRK